MDYKVLLDELKTEIEGLPEDERVKSSLIKIQNIVNHMYYWFIDKEEDQIRLRIDQYAKGRLSKIKADETQISFSKEPKLVVHLLPFEAFKYESHIPDMNLDLGLKDKIKPIYVDMWSTMINRDGIFSSHEPTGFTQVFKSGVIEAVDVGMLSYSKNIPSLAFEKEILIWLERIQEFMEEGSYHGKILILINLINVKGYNIGLDQGIFLPRRTPLSKDDYQLTPIILENKHDCIEEKIKPAFDSFWNLFGFPESKNYQDGKFIR